MKTIFKHHLIAATLLGASMSARAADPITEQEAYEIGVEAYTWVTLYDKDGFPSPNRINRNAIGDRDALKFNADGSLDLYLQHESPGAGMESNWLPAPTDAFNLTMRIYSPRGEVLDGTWAPPPVQRRD